MRHPVLVVGSIALDTLRMPGGKIHRDVVGGSCSYFIHSAGCFAPVRVMGAVGGDFPKKALEGFRRRGADLSGLQMLSGPTFRWDGTYHRDMNSRTTNKTVFGVLEQFDPVLPEKYRDSRFVFLACSQPEHQSRILDQAEKARLAVCDTIEFYIRESRPALDRLIRRCQGMIINDSEARMLSGEENLVAAARAILRKYRLPFMVLKKGEHGGLLAAKDGIFPFPAYPLAKVADPTGAGDSFSGGFMGYLAKMEKTDLKSLRLACAAGTAVASAACEGVSISSLLRATPAGIRARMAEFLRLTRFG
ncbi:MAG: PfkB family carbohydrate kinase [Planctomycetota bacterium]|jgi:sugar/nucleoside kinase (ribokinase family)|nr:PfkB family carbohydrate kinase [Planctomycetota bacterium]